MSEQEFDLPTMAEAMPPLRRVVVIDDSEIDAELLMMRLHELYSGLDEPLWIRSAENLLARVASYGPDLVITDHHMPGYDVVGTITALRRRWPNLPILVMSGLVGEEAATQVLKAGANDFLPKSRSERLAMVLERELLEAHGKRAEAHLRAELEHQRRVNQAIFDQAPVGMWMLSSEGQVLSSNRHGQQLLGGQIKDCSDMRGWWSDSGRPIAPHEWPGRRVIDSGEAVAPDLMLWQTFSGEERHVTCGAAPLVAEDGSPLGAIVTASDITAEVELRQRLTQAEQRLRHLSLNQAELHERQMAGVSRELHDNLGQVLSLLKLHLASAARSDSSPARRDLELAESLPLVDLALSRLREVCSGLRPSELSDFGLGPALSALCAAAQRASGIEVDYFDACADGEPFGKAPAAVQAGLFRIAQQALTNAVSHGAPRHVAISLCQRAQWIELCVEDDGCGFDLSAGVRADQQGLRGMRERMELLGGELALQSSVGGGTTLRARVPAGIEWQGEIGEVP